MKRLLDKSIVALAKVHSKHGATQFVHIYPDGRAMATDGFTLCEIRTAQENQESAPVLEKEWFNLKKPVLLPSEAISKKQKFEDGKALPILSNGFLIKSKNKGGVRHTVTYCQYGDTRQKPTDIWTNCLTWKPKPACKPGSPCHEAAPRGSRTGTQGLKGAVDRGRIPAGVFEEIFDSIKS